MEEKLNSPFHRANGSPEKLDEAGTRGCLAAHISFLRSSESPARMTLADGETWAFVQSSVVVRWMPTASMRTALRGENRILALAGPDGQEREKLKKLASGRHR